jgi:hypothetical protein
MRRFATGFLIGLAAGAMLMLFVLLLRPSRSWQEQSVRAQAEGLGCGLSHGLGGDCVPVAELKKADRGAWTVRYGDARRYICFKLGPSAVPPRREACPTQPGGDAGSATRIQAG